MYKLVDYFTTRNGKVFHTGEQYGISNKMAEKYRADLVNKGCATCIYVAVLGGTANKVHFETVDGYTEEPPIVDGWSHITMYNPGSGYNPENNKGPWKVRVLGYPSEEVEGIGLPYGWHVSTFLVFEWRENGSGDGDNDDGPDEPEKPVELPDRIHMSVTMLGRLYEGWLEHNETV